MHKVAHTHTGAVTPGQVITLMPGQYYFGQHAKLRTLLGSCVAITLWHPQRKVGGMCHYLLPTRSGAKAESLDPRYGDEALTLMAQAIQKWATKSSDYICHLYGGADTMPDGGNLKFNVGERNIEKGWALIDHYGFQLDGVDVGDNVPRNVSIDLRSGDVEVKRGSASPIFGVGP